MKHMGQDERRRIEFLLGCGDKVADIARALGRSESTISRELLSRRIDSDKRHGCSNRLCALFDECQRSAFNWFRNVQRKSEKIYTPWRTGCGRQDAEGPTRFEKSLRNRKKSSFPGKFACKTFKIRLQDFPPKWYRSFNGSLTRDFQRPCTRLAERVHANKKPFVPLVPRSLRTF